jgi:hypothetical protein
MKAIQSERWAYKRICTGSQQKCEPVFEPAGLLRMLKLKRRPAYAGPFYSCEPLSPAQTAVVHVIGNFFTDLG